MITTITCLFLNNAFPHAIFSFREGMLRFAVTLFEFLVSDDYLKNQKWRGYTNVDIFKSKQKVRIKELILNNVGKAIEIWE